MFRSKGLDEVLLSDEGSRGGSISQTETGCHYEGWQPVMKILGKLLCAPEFATFGKIVLGKNLTPYYKGS